MSSLYIGNKNYSSWSLRAWLLLRQLCIPFEERKLSLFTESFKRQVASIAPVPLVPILVEEDGFAVWDTIAIVEHVADRFPDRPVWPADLRLRSRARSLCAEIHAGLSLLRDRLAMNIDARLPNVPRDADLERQIARVIAIWEEQRAAHADRGPFLFGTFSAADAFYAPVVTRFVTYEIDVPPASRAYMRAILALPAMQAWIEEARAEKCFIQEEEPYRTAADVGAWRSNAQL